MYFTWLRGLDSNQRPPGYGPDELPGCSTPLQGTVSVEERTPYVKQRKHPELTTLRASRILAPVGLTRLEEIQDAGGQKNRRRTREAHKGFFPPKPLKISKRVSPTICRDGGIGRRTGLKILRSQGHESSILSPGTKKSSLDGDFLFLLRINETGKTSIQLLVLELPRPPKEEYPHTAW